MNHTNIGREERLYRFGGRICAVTIGTQATPFYQIDSGFTSSGCLIVADENTSKLIPRFLDPDAASPAIAVLAAGEAAKTWSSAQSIITAASKAGLSRDGRIIGIGGGVVTDLAAFAASIYMRGIGLWLVPTTLLAMVDAAVGGKTGFDLLGFKNLVGTFRPADRVLMAADVLRSLPHREWLSGLAEVVKTAIIGDEELLELIKRNVPSLMLGREIPASDSGAAVPTASREFLITEIIVRCVQVKAAIVESDPEERGSRRALLNLGHTFGHALESAAGLGVLTHGEAIAWGIARACELGLRLGSLGQDRARTIIDLLAACGYCVEPVHPVLSAFGADGTGQRKLLAAMAGDKKRAADAWRFVVPREIGAALVTVDADTISAVLT